jgi:hypothetical protein
VDASEVADFAPPEDREAAHSAPGVTRSAAGPSLLPLVAPVSCDIPATRAGDPRFPVGQWQRDRASAWLISGSPACAGDVVGELAAAHARGVVLLTLEAAVLPPHPPGLRVLSAAAGLVPGSETADVSGELGRFATRLGRPTWWTALGRDAATLALIAMRALPRDAATDPRAVAQRRAAARDALTQARARLWSTEATGWTDQPDPRFVKRTVCAIEAPAR